MKREFSSVEKVLKRAQFRWQALTFLRDSSRLGAILSFVLLLFGCAMLMGYIGSKDTAIVFLFLFALAAALAWANILVRVAASSPDHPWLAAALERVNRRLLDRLNTLVFLENHSSDETTRGFKVRIARQTQNVMVEAAAPPFPAARPLKSALAFVAAFMATILFYQIYSPWNHLQAAEKAKLAQQVPRDKEPIESPSLTNVEQNQAWGEVRITDPGADLKVTKVDVVPLQIEAAANQPLKQVEWCSTINGGKEIAHALPPPSEPQYAAYQPELYLDELKLSDWDVLTYYAKASAGQENSFASEVYFVEVRPFREDILKMPGGEGGKPYRCLNQMSTLIERQQLVIRQTHHYIQKPPEQESMRAQDQKKLSGAEGDLRDSVQHLYANMAAEMENKPIGEALDNLAKAEKSLGDASNRLEENVMDEAQNRERSALAELVAARKIFQKTVSENPNAFDSTKDEEPAPVADVSNQLKQMAEFRNETKAAQELVKKTLDQQKSLEQQAHSVSRENDPKLGGQEQRMAKSLEDFQEQHPSAFKSTQGQSNEARDAMNKAADLLQNKNDDAQAAAHQATQKLEQLDQAMDNRAASEQLQDAYRLKQMLDQQTRTFADRAKPDSKVSDSDLQKRATEARETLDQLKKTAEQEPARGAFGQPLRDALNGQKKAELDSKLNELQQANNGVAKQQRAGEAAEALNKVRQAFAASQPKSLQAAQKDDSLKPAQQDSFSKALSELDSLIKQMENHRPIPSKDQAKAGHQALADLQTGVRNLAGNNDRGNHIMLHAQSALGGEVSLDTATLKKLMDELQRFSAETSVQLAKKEDQPELVNIDAARLPPAYRGRIQKYFQKLSEK